MAKTGPAKTGPAGPLATAMQYTCISKASALTHTVKDAVIVEVKVLRYQSLYPLPSQDRNKGISMCVTLL